ncbi:MAG: glycerol kinase GlpK [Burkholderiaceae bacterium]
MAFILSLDQGTTSSRAIVFDEVGRICALAQKPIRQIYPQPGWVEHDPIEIWETQIDCARQALKQANLAASEVAAIGITNQRETAVVWDRATGEPVYNAIVWQDRRGAAWCNLQKERGLLLAVQGKTGLVFDPYFSASKIAWLLENVPKTRERAERGELAFGTVDSWLIWRLTGGLHVTDTSNASRTLLFNIHQGAWAEELAEAFAIPTALLPEVRRSSGDFGTTLPEWLGAPLPIAGVGGDQQAALFGQGCIAPGQVKNTYGTGCFVLMHTGNVAVQSRHGLLATSAVQTSPALEYALEGGVFQAGSAIQWLRDELRIIDSSGDVEALAASVQDSGGVHLVPAFTGLGAPYWDAEARGAILGITRGTARAHIARAAIESIALQSAELMLAMEADSGLKISELRVDGGASANNLLMQFQADLLGIPVVRPRVQETTAQGAADLAALAVGLWQNPAALASARRAQSIDRIFEPVAARDWAEEKLHDWRQAVKRVLGAADPFV